MCYKSGLHRGDDATAMDEEQIKLRAPRTAEENPADYCPVCSRKLEPRNCKLICPECGYYMSCSDFY